jgi:uncharacterized pyridoxamine 5'-phosphate oxidase family protein
MVLTTLAKTYSLEMSLEEIWPRFQGIPLIHLATMDGDHPRVRPVALITCNHQLWAVTHTSWKKTEQIRNNGKMEFTLLFRVSKETGCIRATGRCDIVGDIQTKSTVAKAVPFFYDYWDSPEDSEYTLISLKPSILRVDSPEPRGKYTITIE